MKALLVVRLCRVTDVTTSPERQLRECHKLCEQRGYEVVGLAEDLDISAGKTTPFDRPQLGDWLANRFHEFDVLVVYRMDRIVRRLLDLADLIRWCQDHSIGLVSATEQFLDLTAPFGDIVALLVAKVAEMELSAISERNASAARYNIRAGKYRGGMPPWGYGIEQTGDGWRYVPDREQVAVINEVVSRVLDGEPLRRVAHDLTGRGVLTARDRFAQLQGRAVSDYQWTSGGLKRGLTSRTLLGQVVANGETLRAEDGSPLVRSEPILTPEVFDRVGVELAARELRREPTARSTSLLLQVIACGVCGRPAYRLKGGPGRKPRYRCASAQYKGRCANKSIPQDYAEELVEGTVLRLLSDSERLERVWDSGSDNSEELTEIDATLTDLTSLIGTGPYKAGTPYRAQLNSRIEALTARHADLTAESVRPAGWTWHGTGELFENWWHRQGVEARNIWLREMNVRLEYWCSTQKNGRIGIDQTRLDLGDLKTLTSRLEPGGVAAEWQALMDLMKENGISGIEVFGPDDIRVIPVDQ